jgi:site-specific recombinase XerD
MQQLPLPGTGRSYLHLTAFTAEFNYPSMHVHKSRVCTLRQFYHFLSLHGYAQNIAKYLPYPKAEKTAPQLLTQDDINRRPFPSKSNSMPRARCSIGIFLN